MNPHSPPPCDMSDDELLRHPILILGSPRSGTTLLAGILRKHSALAYMEEPRLTWKYGNDAKSDLLRPEDARPQVVKHIRTAFAARMRDQGRSRLIEKLPDNSLRIPFILKVFPDAMFIHMIRNGVDSVLSIRSYWNKSGGGLGTVRWGRRFKELKLRQIPYYAGEVLRRATPKWLRRRDTGWLWGPRLPGIHQMRREMDLLEICCLQWRMCVELACQHGRRMPTDRYLELRLEEFSRDSLRRVMQFAMLVDDAAVWKEFERRFRPHDAALGARQRDADVTQVRRILDWIEPTMQWLGYVEK